jgi:hypothetical protein
MTRPIAFTIALAMPLAAWAGCTGPQVSTTAALGEPIRVESGQFISGDLPGLPPPSPSMDGGATVDPQVTDVTVADTAIQPGAAGMNISGHASATSQTVALRFADAGSGYWVVPVGPPDPQDNNLPTWQLFADFSRDIVPGFHDLIFSAIDSNGSSGTRYDQPLCVDTPVPDNLNACVPKRAPPAVVLSLGWDAPVDLDLIVRDPLGHQVGGKTSAQAAEGGVPASATPAMTNGVLDHDSNANCVIDNIDREDVIWQTEPPHGLYEVWADMFKACGQPAAAFSVSLWRAEQQPDAGNSHLVLQKPPVASGELTAGQANGGAGLGLYVGSFVLE